MEAAKVKQAEQLFQIAIGLPASERDTLLAERCAGDAGLRALVDQLLAHDATGMGEFMQQPVFMPVPDRTGKNLDSGPESIGRYRITRTVGEGGMGIVYLAEQTEPVRRQVALKVIKPGMDTRQVIARFESERQALAMMNHPGIAKVFDAGVTEHGRPYFVMEHVSGVIITEFCNEHRFNVRQRLELFRQVCQAIQHAHQNGIIHRDIKPSNLLVGEDNGTPIPKVIDFGVAKAISQRLTDKTLFTQQGQFIGTPAYMSPEQAGGTGLDVDTRTDIYSLGALLYELLTDSPPFDVEKLRQSPFDEICRTIREEEPPKPSTRLSEIALAARTQATRPSAKGVPELARVLGMDHRSLVKQLRGDLDWITLKAMEKDRSRRYATASDLAADIQRYLNDEPVLASPPTAVYRFKKFIRRNRAVATGLAAVFVVLVAGTAFTTVFAIGQARARAEAEAARDEAERQAKIAQAVNDFLNNDLLTSVRPGRQGLDVTVREVLDRASEAVEGKFDGEPLVEASVRKTLGVTYTSLGEYDSAEQHLRTALDLHRASFGEHHTRVAASLRDLAELLYYKGDHQDAEALYREAVEIGRSLFGAEHPDVAEALNDLAALVHLRRDYETAENLFREALTIRRKVYGEEHPKVAESLHNLAGVLETLHERAAAESLYRQAMDMSRRLLGDEHPNVIYSQNNLARLLESGGDFQEAERLFRAALATRRKVLGDNHPEVAASLNNLANLLRKKGQYVEAESLASEGLQIRRAALAPSHLHIARSLRLLGQITLLRGRAAEAEKVLGECLDIRRQSLPQGHALLADTESLLGECMAKQTRFAEAEPLLISSYETLNDKLGPTHSRTMAALNRIVDLYASWGKAESAASWRARLPVSARDAHAPSGASGKSE
ncbi:MAG: serine/threonine protein kinase [Phycisphaerales bacterium]|nr:MAG: serine/threonine protein kinase [Phycisphaerales bacterium]